MLGLVIIWFAAIFLTILFGVWILFYMPVDAIPGSDLILAQSDVASPDLDILDIPAQPVVSRSVSIDFDSRFITCADAVSEFSEFFAFDPGYFADSSAYLTTGDFLHMMATYGRYIIDSDAGPVYLLGDSSFMTQAEFDNLVVDLNRNISRNEFLEYLTRIQVCNTFLMNHSEITSVSEYEDLLWGYYREFWNLYNANSSSGRYWLQDVFSGGLGFDRFSSVLHETAHEESARLSHGYVNRSCVNHDWQVVWRDNIYTMHPYNLSSGEFAEISIQYLPDTSDVLRVRNIPKCVKDTVWFQTYVRRSDAISNLFSIYGMTEEFCANMIDVKCAVISDIVGYHGKNLSDDDLKPYYFWSSLICEYLLCLKDYDSELYSQVLSDTELFDLIRDVYSHVSYYIDVLGVEYSNSWDSVALKSWYESERIQSGIAEYLMV